MWEDKGAEMLRVIQLNTLEDRSVHDKQQWDSANQFLEKCLKERLGQADANLREQVSSFKASTRLNRNVFEMKFLNAHRSNSNDCRKLQLLQNPTSINFRTDRSRGILPKSEANPCILKCLEH